MKNIGEKEWLVETIKILAKDLENRAEDIASDYKEGAYLKNIEFKSIIEADSFLEWKVTKTYLAIGGDG